MLLIDKPEGPSSAQVVHRVKTLLGAKKVGHLGTLDPFASGLLLVGINEGTKVADVFVAAAKSYHATMVLGVTTDSQDATGKVLEQKPAPRLRGEDLRALEKQFIGELQQVPPMFSALKKDGVRLYRLARQGKDVPREARAIRIDTLRLGPLCGDEIEFDVRCSRGTYVRTLAADMGEFLGCGAHLKTLRRTACGHLSIDQAVTLDRLEALHAKKKLPLMPLSAALAHLREVRWDSRWVTRLRLGQQGILSHIEKPAQGEKLLRISAPSGDLAALVEWHDDIPGGQWRLCRVFHA